MEAKDTARLGRRAILTAGAAGVAAVAAGALAAPARVAGANGDNVKVGQLQSGTAMTKIEAHGANCFEGWSDSGDGVRGFTHGITKSGVYGWTDILGGYGVFGRGADNSQGVLGGPVAGVQAYQGGAPLALSVIGKAFFSRSGVATIAKGKRWVKVGLTDITPLSFAIAALQQYRANLWVQSITVSASSQAIYIYVSRSAPADTRVAWMVLDGPAGMIL
jgi:hypothetical protein